MRLFRYLAVALCLFLTLVMATAAVAAGKPKPVKPPTKQTQVIRAEVYKKMEVAQKAFDAKDYTGALSGLEALKSGYDKLNDYEKATLWSLYGAVYYAKNDTKAAISAYIKELRQPNLPDGLRDAGLHTLAQLYFIVEDYDKAIVVIRNWIRVSTEPQPDGYVLLAQAYFQKNKFGEAEKALIQSLRIEKQKGIAPKESALALLRAVFYEQKQYPKSAKVLEILIGLSPENASYWQQLAGMYGLLERQGDQLHVMHAAYRASLMNNEGDLLNLARLYMVQNVPYPAAVLLGKAMMTGAIKTNSETLQLYAQALLLAKEYEKQIPVLKQLAEMTGESKHYVFLGQAYQQFDDWTNAAQALRAALKAKNVSKQAEIEVQLGNALYSAGKLEEAREVFATAAQTPATAQTAASWVKFVTSEIQRKQALSR
jgi:tetratricopeptide (TPR) repeat protein